MTLDITTLTKKIALISMSFVLGALLLSGCSSASSDAAVPDTTMSVKDAQAAIATFNQQSKEYDKKVSDCLASKGVTDRDDEPSDKVTAAESACAGELGEAPAPTAEQTAANGVLTRAVQSCLVDKGHKVPDVKADGSWDNDAMSKLSKTDTTLMPDAESCFGEISQ